MGGFLVWSLGLPFNCYQSQCGGGDAVFFLPKITPPNKNCFKFFGLLVGLRQLLRYHICTQDDNTQDDRIVYPGILSDMGTLWINTQDTRIMHFILEIIRLEFRGDFMGIHLLFLWGKDFEGKHNWYQTEVMLYEAKSQLPPLHKVLLLPPCYK